MGATSGCRPQSAESRAGLSPRPPCGLCPAQRGKVGRKEEGPGAPRSAPNTGTGAQRDQKARGRGPGARGRTPGVPHPIPPHDGQRRVTARTRGESADRRGEQPPAAPGAGRGSGSLGPQADKVRAQRLLRTRPGALEKPEGQQPADKGKPRWVTPSGAGYPASMGSGSSFHTPPPSGRK